MKGGCERHGKLVVNPVMRRGKPEKESAETKKFIVSPSGCQGGLLMWMNKHRCIKFPQVSSSGNHLVIGFFYQ